MAWRKISNFRRSRVVFRALVWRLCGMGEKVLLMSSTVRGEVEDATFDKILIITLITARKCTQPVG